jgi:hypothetical protein
MLELSGGAAMIFISYSHEDEDRVRNIVETLRIRTNGEFWRDNQLRAGREYNLEIGRALRDSQAVVVFWSTSSVVSSYVIDEASRARNAHKIIPVKIDDCELPTGFGTLQTVDLTNYHDAPPFGDARLSLLISELRRFEKLPQDVLTVALSEDETDQFELMSRIASGVDVFVGMNSREAVAAMPFIYGLQLIGFTPYLGVEPEEYSGIEVMPILSDLDRAQLAILTFVPTLLVNPRFYEMLIRRCPDKPIFMLIFGSVAQDELTECYNFMKSIPENRIIRRKGVGFPLEGEPAKETWKVVRSLLRSIRE